jgi:hypothetical protein
MPRANPMAERLPFRLMEDASRPYPPLPAPSVRLVSSER